MHRYALYIKRIYIPRQMCAYVCVCVCVCVNNYGRYRAQDRRVHIGLPHKYIVIVTRISDEVLKEACLYRITISVQKYIVEL